MFVCGLDVGRTWVRLVLTADYPGSAPELMEAQRFPIWVEPERILTQLDAWSEHYDSRIEAVVCSSTNQVPGRLLGALESRDQVEWIDGLELRRALAVWRSTLCDRQWLRGGLTSLLFSSPMAYPAAQDTPWRAAWDWRYAQHRRLLLGLEALLMGEGRILCPGHLSPSCPHCEAPWENQESWEDVPF